MSEQAKQPQQRWPKVAVREQLACVRLAPWSSAPGVGSPSRTKDHGSPPASCSDQVVALSSDRAPGVSPRGRGPKANGSSTGWSWGR